MSFVTVGLSLLSYLRRDYRTRYPGLRKDHNVVRRMRPGFVSYVFFTPWHPHTLLYPLDRLLYGVMDKYENFITPELGEILSEADAVIHESSSALFLFYAARRLSPSALQIYRVSDDIRILRSTHPRMIELEQEIAPLFDCVSVPCRVMLDKFPDLPRLHLHTHGIDKKAFDAVLESPYAPGTRNAVLVSAWRTDDEFFKSAAQFCPQVDFHCIGPLEREIKAANIHYYGEMPFSQTLAYIKFADIGLQVVRDMGAATATLTDNLKVIQYRYCGLPIVAPDFLDLHREGIFYYGADSASCAEAVLSALEYGKCPDFAGETRTWDELAEQLLVDARSP